MRLRQPTWTRALPAGLVNACATLGPLGRNLPAPGTWGSLAGLLYFALFFQRLGIISSLLASAIAAYFAVALCGEAEIRLGKRDPGAVILDEVVAMPLCFLGWRTLPTHWAPWAIFLGGFLLFRFYDIVKPFGIRRLQSLPGGWGVVVDDTMAALATCATLHVGAWLWAWR
jgi:phosphatidylglycerophosphatase A